MKKFNLILVSAMMLMSTISCNSNGTEDTPEGLTGGDIEKSLKPQVSVEKIANVHEWGTSGVYQIIINSDTFYIFRTSEGLTSLKK